MARHHDMAGVGRWGRVRALKPVKKNRNVKKAGVSCARCCQLPDPLPIVISSQPSIPTPRLLPLSLTRSACLACWHMQRGSCKTAGGRTATCLLLGLLGFGGGGDSSRCFDCLVQSAVGGAKK